jgi:hypothetical protein
MGRLVLIIKTNVVPCWWEELEIRTHLRLAAGVCVLFTGLLFGGASGAIATAHPDAGNSGAKDQGAAGPSQGANSPLGTAANNLRKTVQQTVLGVTHTLGSLAKPPVIANAPKTSPVSSNPTSSNSTSSNSTSNAHATTAAVPSSVESNPNAGALATNGVTPATDPIAPVSNVVAPITNAVATVASTVESVPAMVLSLPTSATPVADVITTVQNVLTSVSNAVIPLSQLPSDLASLLGVTAVNDPTVVTGVGSVFAGPAAVAGTPVLASPPQAFPIPGISGVPLAGSVAAPAALAGIAVAGLSQEVSTSAMTPLAPSSATPTDVMSILRHTVRALLAPASLSALAAVALPGVGGLLIICAAGMRVGYRQAKAGWALQITGLARFAGSGPLGVVRSGSLVALRPRALRVVRPEVSRAAYLLDHAA